MMEASPYANMLFDTSLRLLDCNPAACAYFGFAGKAEMQKGFLQAMKPRYGPPKERDRPSGWPCPAAGGARSSPIPARQARAGTDDPAPGPRISGHCRGFNPGTAFVAPAAQAPASEVPAAARRGLKRVWQLRQ